MDPHDKKAKLKDYLLITGLVIAILAVVIASSKISSTRLSLFGRAQSTTQIVKAWNFDQANEGWKSRYTRDSRVKNGSLNVRIGQTFFSPLIFNRRVFAQMPLPLKYFSINLAIQKRKEANLPPNQPTPIPVEPLTSEDVQILSLPEQVASPSAGNESIACITDVKTCPDGTFVSRVAPKCEFLPCSQTPSPFFSFDFQFKTIGSAFWSKPLPITGKISPYFSEYTVKLPVFDQLTIEAIKLEFSSGISKGDIILIDSIKLLNEKLIVPSIITPTPTTYVSSCNRYCSPTGPQCSPDLKCIQFPPPQPLDSTQSAAGTGMPPPPYLCRNPQCPTNPDCKCIPTPTSVPVCISPPPCAFGGMIDERGYRLYCDPMPGVIWCPKPTITIIPCSKRPPCADGIMSPEGYKMYCYPPVGGNWCPVTPTPTLPPSTTPIPCALPTAPYCDGGTLQASDELQSPGVCPPKYICVFSDTPTPTLIPTSTP